MIILGIIVRQFCNPARSEEYITVANQTSKIDDSLAHDDYNRALELDPKYSAYKNRGYCYLLLSDIKQAQTDFIRSSQLDSTNINNCWMPEWASMCQEKPGLLTAERLEAIAANAPNDVASYICRGVAL